MLSSAFECFDQRAAAARHVCDHASMGVVVVGGRVKASSLHARSGQD